MEFAAKTSVPVPIVYKRFAHTDAPCPAIEKGQVQRDAPQAAIQVPPSTAWNLSKRKRSDIDADERDGKPERHHKIKKEDHDGQRAEVRAELEAKRKNWLLANRSLFEPLLSTAFFGNLVKDLEGKATPPLPMCNFAAQPKLIEGGKMKGYQLAGLSFLAHMYHNGMVHVFLCAVY
jgi:SWI/SNF-related matrix-associated actin-dependent regulator of chromatin subfamily A member 5